MPENGTSSEHDAQFIAKEAKLPPSENLLMQGDMVKSGSLRNKTYVWFLFKSTLAYAKRTKKGKLELHNTFPLDALSAVQALPDKPKKKKFPIKITAGKKSMTFWPASAAERDTWVAKLQPLVVAKEETKSKDAVNKKSSGGGAVMADPVLDPPQPDDAGGVSKKTNALSQEALVGLVGRKKAKPHHQRAAVQIQSHWRGRQERKQHKLETLRARKEAALAIKAVLRGLVLHQQRLHAQQAKAAAVIQAYARSYIARQQLAAARELAQRTAAAQKIQTRARGMLARKQVKQLRVQRAEELAQRQKAALLIQSIFRAHVVREELREALEVQRQVDAQRNAAATRIQAIVRGKLGKKKAHDERLERLLAAGQLLTKHHAWGKPKPRWITCRQGVITWSHNAAIKGTIPLNEVKEIRAGKDTPNLIRSYTSGVGADMCFAVLTKKRTLELQCNSVQERNLWVEALQHAMAKHSVGGRKVSRANASPKKRKKGRRRTRGSRSSRGKRR